MHPGAYLEIEFENEYIKFNLLGKSTPNAAGLFSIIEIRNIRMEMIALFLLQISIIPKQLIQTAAECKQNQRIDEKELDDIDDHSSE